MYSRLLAYERSVLKPNSSMIIRSRLLTVSCGGMTVRDNIFLLLLLQLLLQPTGERRFSRSDGAGCIDRADPVGEHVQAFLEGFVDLICEIQKPRVRGERNGNSFSLKYSRYIVNIITIMLILFGNCQVHVSILPKSGMLLKSFKKLWSYKYLPYYLTILFKSCIEFVAAFYLIVISYTPHS